MLSPSTWLGRSLMFLLRKINSSSGSCGGLGSVVTVVLSVVKRALQVS